MCGETIIRLHYPMVQSGLSPHPRVCGETFGSLLSLFDYTIIGFICRHRNVLLVSPISRYCFRNPLVVSDLP